MKSRFQVPRYTYSDYKNWKEDWELVDGYPFQIMPLTSIKQSKVRGNLVYQIGSIRNKNRNLNFDVYPRLDWKIYEDTVVRPDIMIVCGEPKNEILEFPPVLIIELLSPYNRKNQRVIKFELYRENGVKYYLMVDVIKENVEVFELIDNFYKQVERTVFQIDKNCEINFDYDEIWK